MPVAPYAATIRCHVAADSLSYLMCYLIMMGGARYWQKTSIFLSIGIWAGWSAQKSVKQFSE
jgi:hypothetical protein